MKKLLPFLVVLFLSAPFLSLANETTNGTKIKTLFWNIGGNRYNPHEGGYQTPLDLSLRAIANEDYDVLALSEYATATLDNETVQALNSEFKYSSFFPYVPNGRSGIKIFSKFEFTSISLPIDWVRPNWSKKFQESYKKKATKLYRIRQNFVRDYIRITLNKNETEFNIVFFHFISPWNGLVESLGKYPAGAVMMFGHYTPVSNQIMQMKSRFIQDLGRESEKKNIIMMGDSNCPYKYLGVMSSCYRLMRKILPPIYDPKRLGTYPAEHSVDGGKLPFMKIDHAFASKGLKSELGVLSDVKGSDHLGLSMVSEVIQH